MKHLFTFLILILLSQTAQAQQISEVNTELIKLKRIVQITYNLLAETKLHERQVFDIQVFVSLDNGKTFQGPLEYVGGDIRAVEPDINRKIIWNFYPEMPDFGGEQVVFKLVGKLNRPTEEKRIMSLGTTSSVWQSLVLPGWGSSRVRGEKNRWYIGAAAYGLVGSGVFLKLNGDKNYRDYQTIQNPETARATLDKARQQRQLSQYLLIGGGAIWLGDMVYTLIRGSKNDRLQKEIISRKTTLSWHWRGNEVGIQWRF
jgi:hypothetical protein